jgi:hypothetical protein
VAEIAFFDNLTICVFKGQGKCAGNGQWKTALLRQPQKTEELIKNFSHAVKKI